MSTDLFDVIEVTWPAASKRQVGAYTLRDGAGGGKRVSAVTLEGAFEADTFEKVASEELFSIRRGQDELDTALADRGFEIIDPSILYICPIEQLSSLELPRVAAFEIWPPLQIMCDVWDVGGIGKARRDVMERADCVKTSILGRISDRAAGSAFVGVHEGVAMVHALEIDPEHRRKGLAKLMMICAAQWGAQNGAHTMALVTTDANEASKGLYTSMGMTLVDGYHYRKKR